mmetsp:Transcript_78646/g.151931  ORF Transcript_78646/g.151931 Transcript_78646/m.151931 type:complete len:141 (+) Transcript_78646:1-423(+)
MGEASKSSKDFVTLSNEKDIEATVPTVNEQSNERKTLLKNSEIMSVDSHSTVASMKPTVNIEDDTAEGGESSRGSERLDKTDMGEASKSSKDFVTLSNEKDIEATVPTVNEQSNERKTLLKNSEIMSVDSHSTVASMKTA